MRHSARFMGTLAALACPVLAHAQQAAPPVSQPDEVPAAEQLGDIVVTAQKRAENVQDIPIAITAVSGDQLAAIGVRDTTQLTIAAPGLNVRADAGAFQPSIRGIGTSSTVVENPVALYIDGVYFPQQREGARDLNDIDQVAVLKGPQGTLFGRNATAGVIQITTKRPSHDFAGRFHAEIDNYATIKSNAYLTGGLTNTVAASLSLSYGTQGNGWGQNLTTGTDTFRILHDFSIRGALLYEPVPGTDVILRADYADWKRYANSRQPYGGLPLSVPGTGPLSSVYDTYGGRDAFNALTGGGASLTINQDTSFGELVSITAYRDVTGNYLFDNSSVPQPFFIVESPNSPSRSFSQELQLISDADGPLSWVLGAFFFNYNNGANPIIRSFSGPLTPLPTSAARTTTHATESTRSIAPFGEATVEFLPRTRLTFGLRYTYERRELQDASIETRTAGGVTSTARFDPAPLSVNKVTYRAALNHDFGDNVLGYVSFNTGFKSGGFNTVSPATPAYLPEELTAYEIGLKSELFDRRLRLNFAAYYYDYSNLQVIQFIGVTQAVVNGPSAKLYGLDIDFEARLGGGLRLSGGAAISHSEFTAYNNAVFSAPRPGGGALIFPGDATGNRLPLAQEFTGTLAIDYRHSSDIGAIDANLTTNYNGDYFFTADNFPRQDDYVMINASLKWTLPNDRWSITVFGRNLADERVITTVTEQAIGYPAIYGSAPRTYGVALDLRF